MLKILTLGLGITSLSAIGLLFSKHCSRKKNFRDTFSSVYSPLVIRLTHIKKSYGFDQKQLYLIKDHRTKQSTKMTDTLQLADDIFLQVEKNEAAFSSKVLEHYYRTKEITLEKSAHFASNPKNSSDYYINQAEYELHKSKLLLAKAFIEEMTYVAKKADVLYPDLEETLDFFPVFLDHLLEHELIVSSQRKQDWQQIMKK
ncbi:hypothetical protein [Mesobacillus zeae]|uniref:Uncharacterized protein n=1 Tax=Mesobacillus zeae TaxID=1917180 RepID=A0A398BAH8_9BACI|nr:hypothetical protein [Mesobacillus zeae]RID86827.1 hypothetical protein D1970_06130 [Mesobacillus zeae]